jgi:transposase
MPMLEGKVDVVIGVDTHRDRHAAALLDPNGGVRATLEVPSDRSGHARLFRLAQVHAGGRRIWALEGTGCYGAGLTRFLVDQGEWVVEIDRPKRPRGRHGAKSDARRQPRGPDRHRPRAAAGPATGPALAPAGWCLRRAGRRPR